MGTGDKCTLHVNRVGFYFGKHNRDLNTFIEMTQLKSIVKKERAGLNHGFQCFVPILEAFIESKIRDKEYLIKIFQKYC